MKSRSHAPVWTIRTHSCELSTFVQDMAHEGEVLSLEQVHGTTIVDAAKITKNEKPKADGVLWYWDTVRRSCWQAAMIRTADCAPVLVIGSKGGALIHAGWRGAAAGILGRLDYEAIGAQRAFIGPCLQWENFEVGEEFASKFPEQFLQRHQTTNKRHFDLSGFIRYELRQLYPGLGERVHASTIDTYSRLDLPSHRRDKTKNRLKHVFSFTGLR